MHMSPSVIAEWSEALNRKDLTKVTDATIAPVRQIQVTGNGPAHVSARPRKRPSLGQTVLCACLRGRCRELLFNLSLLQGFASDLVSGHWLRMCLDAASDAVLTCVLPIPATARGPSFQRSVD